MTDLGQVFEGFELPSDPCVVSYDVDSIKSYIFAPDEFQGIIGGSVLVRQFDEEIAEVLSDIAVKVFTGGGSGMFLTSSSDREMVERRIEETFKDNVPGASITVVSASLKELEAFFKDNQRPQLKSDFELFTCTNPTFYGVFSYLSSKMGRKKKDKLRTSETLVNASEEPCEICGIEKPEHGGVCKACRAKEKAVSNLRSGSVGGKFGELWKTMSLNLDGIATKMGEGQRGWLGVIYGDGNGLGRVYEKIETAKGYAKFSEKLESAIVEAVESVVKDLKLKDQFAAPILGGDDLMLLVPANRVFEVLDELVESLKENLKKDDDLKSKDITFSFGVAVIPSTLPIRFNFELAQKLLKSAKESSYQQDGKGYHVAYRFMEMGVFKPKNDFKIHERIRAKLGHGMLYEQFKELVEEVKRLKRHKKRNLLYKLLTVLESDPAEAKINAYYFCSRNNDYFKDRDVKRFVDNWVLSPNGNGFVTQIPTMLEMWDFVGEG